MQQLDLGLPTVASGATWAIALVRELAPLITGLIIIGRSGTAVVVELGNMRVSGEIDTLESMGIDVFEYLVIPRMGAFALSTFVMPSSFLTVALIAGVLDALFILEQIAPALIWCCGAPSINTD